LVFNLIHDELIEGYVIEAARRVIESIIREEVKVFSLPLDVFREAYNGLRWQYNAKIILEKIEEFEKNFVYIISKDIYTVRYRFVYGVSKVGVGSVISVYRIFQGVPKEWQLMRLEKVLKHELGHYLGLRHCRNKCVMRFSNGLFMLDYKPSSFCVDCENQLKGFV